MATISFTREDGQGRTYVITWANLGTGDDGDPVRLPGAGDFSVQVFGGSFSGSAALVLEGSCEKTITTYFNLKDPQGNNLSFTSADGELVSEVVGHVRPRVTSGDGSTDITVVCRFRSPR